MAISVVVPYNVLDGVYTANDNVIRLDVRLVVRIDRQRCLTRGRLTAPALHSERGNPFGQLGKIRLRIEFFLSTV